MITAPYNFIPLNEKVFYPSWSNQVSHDIPFGDSENGEIDIEVEAKSPIFIRNHSKDKENPSDEFCHFLEADDSKRYYIPGSSIKGMVRSVMEILSFAKIEFVDDATFSVRDMTNRNELVGQANGCGFLVKKDNRYIIEDCGKPITISFDEVKNATGKWLKNKSSAKEKYNLLGSVLLEIPIKKNKKMMKMRNGKTIPKDIAKYDSSSVLKGTLVTSGQINNKKNEFIFIKNGQYIQIDTKIVDRFKKVYFNEDSIDGNFWQTKHKNGNKIPIFYKKNGNKIQAIGLTQLFKLSYNKTIHKTINQDKKAELDLPETIFGTVKDDFALKGRVQFSHLASTHVRFEQEIKEEVLGTPNPSYYPNYIEQSNTNGDRVNSYTTLMDSDAKIRGYKRYPLRNQTKSYPLPTDSNGKINHDVTTKFKPLDAGVTFKGKIRFHNLKKAEIGALLSAITLHGKSGTHYHNIGMAKSLGYGKIQIKIIPKNLNYTHEEYLKAFEDEITKEIPEWKNSPQLRELFAMTDSKVNNDDKLVYQQLKNSYGKNEFVEAKKRKEYLQPYSEFGKTNQTKPNQNNKSHPNRQKPKQKETLNDLSNHFATPKKSSMKRGLTIVKKKRDKE